MEKRPSTQGRKTEKTTPTKSVIRTQFNKSYKGTLDEKNFGPSLTVPDQSLSILTLLQNHTRNIQSDVHIYQDPQYFEEEIPQFDDPTERQEYIEELENKMAEALETQKQIKADLKAKQIKKAQEDKQKEKPSETPPKPSETDSE